MKTCICYNLWLFKSFSTPWLICRQLQYGDVIEWYEWKFIIHVTLSICLHVSLHLYVYDNDRYISDMTSKVIMVMINNNVTNVERIVLGIYHYNKSILKVMGMFVVIGNNKSMAWNNCYRDIAWFWEGRMWHWVWWLIIMI